MRVVGIVAVGLLALVTLAVGGVWVGSELLLRKAHPLPPTGFAASGTPEAIERGDRLVRVLGCYDGCHGPAFEGGVFLDDPVLGRIVAPNLTEIAAARSDAELDRSIRYGLRPDGRSVIGMPSHLFRHMTDRDLDAVVSFLRSETTVPNPELPSTRLGPLARLGLVVGMFDTNAVMAADDAPEQTGVASQRAYASTEAEVRGHYLATLACAECHGPDFAGNPQAAGGTPDLRMALAYDSAAFVALMREGRAHDGRDIGLMGEMSSRFRHLADDDIASLRAFLRARAAAMTGAPTGG